MKPKDLVASAEVCAATYPDQFGLSFWSWPGMTAAEVAREVRRNYPIVAGRHPVLAHPVLRASTAGQIRGVVASDGQRLQLEKTRGPGHYTVLLPSPPTPKDYSDLIDAFNAVEPNPVRV